MKTENEDLIILKVKEPTEAEAKSLKDFLELTFGSRARLWASEEITDWVHIL